VAELHRRGVSGFFADSAVSHLWVDHNDNLQVIDLHLAVGSGEEYCHKYPYSVPPEFCTGPATIIGGEKPVFSYQTDIFSLGELHLATCRIWGFES
jgi:hypothetical protein